MRAIPVLDLKGGRVVRAIRGDRGNYGPIQSRLAPGTSEPAAIARALLALSSAFDSLYVADIDAILGASKDAGLEIAAGLATALPGVRILFDNGVADAADVRGAAAHPLLIPVVGTETLRSARALQEISQARSGGLALSLDWRGDRRLGPADIFEESALWPETVIVMTLDRVGSGTGPDFTRLEQVKAMAGEREVLAAGGVRGIDDLRALKAVGCGALLSTALHDGALTPSDLEEFFST